MSFVVIRSVRGLGSLPSMPTLADPTPMYRASSVMRVPLTTVTPGPTGIVMRPPPAIVMRPPGAPSQQSGSLVAAGSTFQPSGPSAFYPTAQASVPQIDFMVSADSALRSTGAPVGLNPPQAPNPQGQLNETLDPQGTLLDTSGETVSETRSPGAGGAAGDSQITDVSPSILGSGTARVLVPVVVAVGVIAVGVWILRRRRKG